MILTTRMTDAIDDPLLALYDSKGDLIEMNDDIGLNDVGLDVRASVVTITPDVSGIYYVSASIYIGAIRIETITALT